MTITCSNPEGVHAPLGLYSHTVSVPEGTELIFLSGQLGVRPDGSAPSTIAEQADQVFANIITLLRSHGLQASHIIKLTTFMVAGHDGQGGTERQAEAPRFPSASLYGGVRVAIG
jgi:2-iminobutanoate/2-iminopropanoate deaminase